MNDISDMLNLRGIAMLQNLAVVTCSQERDMVNVDLAASGVEYKECLNMLVIAEVAVSEQSEHLREYFLE